MLYLHYFQFLIKGCLIPSCESMDESSKYGGKIDSVSLTNFSILEDDDTSKGIENDFNEDNAVENATQGIIPTFRK